MPRITKTNDQEKALDTIINTLKVLKNINKFQDTAGSEEPIIAITVGKARVSIPYANKDAMSLVAAYRKNAVAAVKNLADKYSITLDDADMTVLENKKAEPVKEEASVPEDKEDAQDPAGVESVAEPEYHQDSWFDNND